MPQWIADLFHWLGHYRPRYAVMVSGVTALLLFSSTKTLARFGLDAFVHDHKAAISLIFVAATVLLLTYPLEYAGKATIGAFRAGGSRHKIKSVFYNLGSDEITVLTKYAESGKSSVRFPLTNGAVHSLVNKGVLYRPQPQTTAYGEIAYNIVPLAVPHLRYDKFQKAITKSSEKLQPKRPKRFFLFRR